MSVLVLCLACSRHVRSSDLQCPFCGCAGFAAPVGPGVLHSGASRSRRYAASAAFLAGAATFACSGGPSTLTAGQGIAEGGSVGTDTGGVANGGARTDSSGTGNTSGGASGSSANGGGSAGTTMEHNAGGLNAGGDTAAGGMGTLGGGSSGMSNSSGAGASSVLVEPTGRACEGSTDSAGCRTVADCPATTTEGTPYCALSPRVQSQGCGNPTFIPSCTELGCDEGLVCIGNGVCGASYCAQACDPATCNGENECVDNLCRQKNCDASGAAPCGEGYECDPTQGGVGRNCVKLTCDAGGRECASTHACNPSTSGADVDGCVQKACDADAACGDCGYCVNGGCENTLGHCYVFVVQPAMPYGCVWPDDELV